MRHPAVALLLVLLAGCQTTPPEQPDGALEAAERQFQAIQSRHVPPETPQTGPEHVLRAGHLGELLVGIPVFGTTELFQLLVQPVYWGYQDAVVEGSVREHARICRALRIPPADSSPTLPPADDAPSDR